MYPIVAAVFAAGCVAVAARRAARVGRVELPDVATVLERIRAAAPPGAGIAERSFELDDLVREADRLTVNPRELSSQLSRIPLATGTALALLSLAGRPELAELPQAGVTFGVGVGGSVVVAYFGRLASERAQRARAHWSDLVRRVRARIESETEPLATAARPLSRGGGP